MRLKFANVILGFNRVDKNSMTDINQLEMFYLLLGWKTLSAWSFICVYTLVPDFYRWSPSDISCLAMLVAAFSKWHCSAILLDLPLLKKNTDLALLRSGKQLIYDMDYNSPRSLDPRLLMMVLLKLLILAHLSIPNSWKYNIIGEADLVRFYKRQILFGKSLTLHKILKQILIDGASVNVPSLANRSVVIAV